MAGTKGKVNAEFFCQNQNLLDGRIFRIRKFLVRVTDFHYLISIPNFSKHDIEDQIAIAGLK